MKTDFINKLIAFLKEAEGLPEAVRNNDQKIVNWPCEFQKEYAEIMSQIGNGWSDDDSLEFANWWKSYKNNNVPQGIIGSITKCFYENPWLTFPAPMRLADARELINTHNIPWDATVEAAGIIANSPEATFEDLLGMLKIAGLPQEWAAIALYKRTKRPSENRLNPLSTDYSDWAAYLKNKNLI